MNRFLATVTRNDVTNDLSYGYDSERGFWVSIGRSGKLIANYMSIVSGYEGLAGAVDFLLDYDVVHRQDATQGLAAVFMGHPIDAIEDPDARIVAQILTDLVEALREGGE